MCELTDPLHDSTTPDIYWTTANVGEAIPGVQTPLSWSVWGTTSEGTTREAFRAVGAFAEQELPFPAPPGDRIVKVFYGRACLEVDAMAALGDRMPGTSGGQVVAGIFGEIPSGMAFSPTRRRYPQVAWGLTRQHLTISARLARAAQATALWWRDCVVRVPQLQDPIACTVLFREALQRFYDTLLLQTIALFCAVQPVYDALSRLAKWAGIDDVADLTSGFGGVPEAAIVGELWRCSRGRITVSDIVDRFGHHGPLEGSLHGVVWREDDTPLRQMVDQYAALSDGRDPAREDRERSRRRRHVERQLVTGLPAPARPLACAVIARAARVIPMRGVAKDTFLQAIDVARATARRAGELYAASGTFDDAEDVFFLTATELCDGPTRDARAVVAYRRQKYDDYCQLRLPPTWRGAPRPIRSGLAAPSTGQVRGTGVSPGVVEGPARVVTDPTFADVESGEVLVSATTDPSWASIMFLSSALVVDIGGPLSHAALVARELGLPCVVNTVTGSDVIRTGDRLRVDGRTGIVEILERSAIPGCDA